MARARPSHWIRLRTREPCWQRRGSRTTGIVVATECRVDSASQLSIFFVGLALLVAIFGLASLATAGLLFSDVLLSLSRVGFRRRGIKRRAGASSALPRCPSVGVTDRERGTSATAPCRRAPSGPSLPPHKPCSRPTSRITWRCSGGNLPIAVSRSRNSSVGMAFDWRVSCVASVNSTWLPSRIPRRRSLTCWLCKIVNSQARRLVPGCHKCCLATARVRQLCTRSSARTTSRVSARA